MKTVAKKNIPFEFVLETLSRIELTVKPFFGCHSIYIREKIVLILRNKKDHPNDNGVWIATSKEHHTSLQKLFPNMRSIDVFAGSESNWQILPSEADDFEESVMQACALILKNDTRIGRIPKKKKRG